MSAPTAGPLNEQIQATVRAAAAQAPAPVIDAIFGNIAQMVQGHLEAASLNVGELAPDFSLPDQHGQVVRLSELLAHGPVVVSFYRGDWCPFCNLTLRAYQAILPQITALGARLVAISAQTPDHSRATAEHKELTYMVLSDVGNVVSKRYGVAFTLPAEVRPVYLALNSDVPDANGDGSWELPMPGTFVIGRDGSVALAFVDPDYTHRLEPEALLDGLRRLGRASGQP